MDISGTMTKGQLLLEYSRKKQQLSEVEEAIRRENAKSSDIGHSKSAIQSTRKRVEESFTRQKNNVTKKIRSVQEDAVITDIYMSNVDWMYFSKAPAVTDLLQRAEKVLETAERNSSSTLISLRIRRATLTDEIEKLKQKIANA